MLFLKSGKKNVEKRTENNKKIFFLNFVTRRQKLEYATQQMKGNKKKN